MTRRGLALFLVLIACGDPESPGGPTGGSGGAAGSGAGGKGGSSAGAGQGGSSGSGAGGKAGSSTGGSGGSGGSSAAGGSGGSSASGGSGGSAASSGSGGSSAGAGNAGAAGSAASAGTANGGTGGIAPGCECPATAPLSGGPCPEDCAEPVCAYEDCDGEGFIQAACAGEWIIIQQACGDKPCGNDDMTSCAPGTVCIQIVGGVVSGYTCVPHECGTGAITCDCLGSNCPGECTRTGGTTFTCNTCPSGLCP